MVTDWAKSWEQWANGGTGGCISENGTDGCIDLLGGFFLEKDVPAFTNSSCTESSGTYSNPRIYAPAGYDDAALCEEFSDRQHANGPYGEDTWDCANRPAG